VPIRSGSDASSDGSTVSASADVGDDDPVWPPVGEGRADGAPDVGDPRIWSVDDAAGDGEVVLVALGAVDVSTHPQATRRLSVTAAATPRVCMTRL
jgi:hypothetical protein